MPVDLLFIHVDAYEVSLRLGSVKLKCEGMELLPCILPGAAHIELMLSDMPNMERKKISLFGSVIE